MVTVILFSKRKSTIFSVLTFLGITKVAPWLNTALALIKPA